MAALKRVAVVIGSGGMGIASARRIAGGRTLILADASNQRLQTALETLKNDGYSPSGHIVDVSSSSSVQQFATEAANAGAIDVIVHTAGVSPITSTTKQIYSVDLVGTANVIDAFQPHLQVGTSFVSIASMAGHMAIGSLSQDLQKHLATAPTSSLLSHPHLSDSLDPGHAYSIAKAANQLRVQAASKPYGEKGARINSVSPGIIATVMGNAELAGSGGNIIRAMVEASGLKRVGTSDDVAAAVGFLAGPESSFITGSDILVDGKQCLAVRYAT